jgi:hypothetical protein
MRESDLEFARAAAAGQIKTAEGLLETIPEDRDVLELTANGYLQYAFGFLEDDLESTTDHDARDVLIARATDFYDRATRLAVRHLATFNPALPGAVRGGGSQLEQIVGGLPRAAVPGLCYAGAAVASAINLNRADPSRLVDLPKAILLLERARALDRSFAAGLAPMVLGIIYAQKAAAGGDPARARRYFEEAVGTTRGQYLMARVMFGRSMARATDDENLLRETMTTVLHQDVGALPPLFRLANEFARRRAARSLYVR